MSADRKTRVLALVTDAFGGHGGIAQYNKDFFSALTSDERVEVDILPRLGELGGERLPARIKQHKPVLDRIRYAVKSIAFGLKVRPDVVFSGHVYHGWLGLVIARLCGAKLISQVHGKEVWGKIPWLAARALQHSHLILAVSRDTRRKLLSRVALKPEAVAVLNNTVGPAYFPGDREKARRAFGVSKEVVILTISRLDGRERYKGHERVLDAIPTLVANGIDAYYLIAGDGNDQARLQGLVHRKDLSSRVRFLGRVNQGCMADLYRAADIFALPSTGEGFGIAFLEAMACGTPAIGLSVGGSSDALADGALGACVDSVHFGQALLAALRQPKPDPCALSDAVQRRFGWHLFQEHCLRVIFQ